MKCYFLAGVLLALAQAQAAEVSIDPDRMLVVNGQRTFVLGLYENPADDAVLKSVKDAGFNLVYAQPDTASLDRLQQHELWAWVNTGASIDLSDESAARQEQLKALAAGAGQHPALIVWEVPDEALWNNWYSAVQWRMEQEPRRLGQEIDKHVSAPGAAKAARENTGRAERLRRVGNYAAAEALMDEAWTLLGIESPHPGFGLGNAPERAEKMRGGMVAGYQALKKLDPNHPIWANHAPRNPIRYLAGYNEGADIAGCDIYPVAGPPWVQHSDLVDQSNSAVGMYTDRMQEAAPGKPVWMVLQGFAWSDLEENPTEESLLKKRAPTLDETRFMAFDTIVHGARGILYWGTYKAAKDGALWKDLLQVAGELGSLQPVLSAPDAKLTMQVDFQETNGSIDRELLVLAKDAPDGVWLLLVNENAHPVRFDLSALTSLEGKQYKDFYLPEETCAVSQGQLKTYVAAKSFVLLAPR